MMDIEPVLKDTKTISVNDLATRRHAQRMNLTQALPLLASPDSGLTLIRSEDFLSDGKNRYPLREEIPLLLPASLHEYFSDRLSVPAQANRDSFFQYFYLSSIKQSGEIGEINASFENEHYQRHLHRMNEMVADCHGTVLDVGCDNPKIGASIFPFSATYVGLDPFCQSLQEFRLIGVAEFLPFLSNSLDNVVFNTSLDHVLDWHRAINEAYRVLVKDGALYISTLVWTQNADLLSDSVHFHHFREYEILQGLEGFKIMKTKRYDYKGNEHRHGLYLKAVKK